MHNYDTQFNMLIDMTMKMFEGKEIKEWGYNESKAWPNAQSPNILTKANAAVEMDGSRQGGVNYLCPTPDEKAVVLDKIILLGPDICEIRNCAPMGRITIAYIDFNGLEERQAFNLILDIDNAKHRVQPEGYVVDYNQAARFENVRVSEENVRNRISFENIGSNYIKEFKNNARVKAVTEIFITDASFDFNEAEMIGNKTKNLMVAVRAHGMTPRAHA